MKSCRVNGKYLNYEITKMRRNKKLLVSTALALTIFTLFYSLNPSLVCAQSKKSITVGAERTDLYISLLKGKSVAVVANQTSMIKQTHLVDSLLALGIKVKRVFSPEHGFRGGYDAGEHVSGYKDKKTGLPIISLYGDHNKPTKSDLEGIDVVVFDIQDVGVRFYTYISTMHYVMEACAENKITFLLLDRPRHSQRLRFSKRITA